jgi:hypothetical protein
MKTNAEYKQIANARKVAAAAATEILRREREARRELLVKNAEISRREREARRELLVKNAERRKAERALLRSRRNYRPGWSNAFPAGTGARR